MRIRILACGGTIDKVYFDAKSDYQVGDPQIETIFREARVTFDFVIEPVFQKDSLDMTDDDRHLLRSKVEEADERHILITHGTDTMTMTALALAGIPNKTIVLTGSMTPAKFHVSDAAFNIGCAVGALQSQPAGVYIAMNGRVFCPTAVRKNVEKNVFEAIDGVPTDDVSS